jgi:hypothetical protein
VEVMAVGARKLSGICQVIAAFGSIGIQLGCTQQSAPLQSAMIVVRELGGVKLRPEAAEVLEAVERVSGKSVSVSLRDDLAEAVQGYSFTAQDGTPTIVLARGKGQNEENIVHELFHLKMLNDGYPLFDFDMSDAERSANGKLYLLMRTLIYDPITHSLFYPKMRQMGLDPDSNTREQLQKNRLRSEQPSVEWLATYFMKVSLETSDPKLRDEVEHWYEEKGWTVALQRGRALLQVIESLSEDPESVALIVVKCLNVLFHGQSKFTAVRVEHREYGSAIRRYVIVRVEQRS